MTLTKDETELDALAIDTIRTLSIDGVEKASSGHPGAPMALAPVAYQLFTRTMKHNPENPGWFDRDRFVLSAGHASMLLYSILHLTGYGISMEDLKSFRQLLSPTAGHPEYEADGTPGIEVTTGPLGQGLSNSVGFALAERLLAARFNRDGHEIVDHHTYAIASDGDMQEGVAAEASSLAGHLRLGRLTVFYDDNHIQLAGPTSMGFSEDVGKRYEAYGWHVQNLGEDLSTGRLAEAIDAAHADDRPSLVILRTHIGFGAPNKQDSQKAHGSPLGEDEVRATKEAYGWDPDKTFYVPDEAAEHFGEAVDRGKQAEAEWTERLDAYREAHADLADELALFMERRLPDGWDADLPRFSPDDDPIATRKASEQVIQWAAKQVPTLVSGSADLEPSTNTEIEDGGSVTRDDYSGRNVHFGVREHAMGGIVNGLNLHGVRAFGSTFFNFVDYMKGSVRLAALMGLPVIHVFTHDSIGLGEDGPTHQPVEQLATLRATPNVNVVRPADANETALAWKFALSQTDGPCALVLSRQGIPILDPDSIPDDAVAKGAYVLRDPAQGEPDVILIGTGAEVATCVDAAEKLEAEGLATRVVSMPCWDRFIEAGREYQEQVLPPSVRARVSVEAGATIGWDRWVGPDGASIGMTGFGASGPAPELLEHFGFTPENVAECAKEIRAARKRGNPDVVREEPFEMAQNERLQALTQAGVSVWLDQIHRAMIASGELRGLVDEYSLRGETSNPAIFEKAILGSADYDDKIAELASEDVEPVDAYLRIAIEDVTAACDVMRPVYDELDHYDGFVSLEVEPSVAHDTAATAKQARELWESVDRPNVMIKIPGTTEGVQAIEDATADGINVNVTLLFSVESYENVAEAYIRGMERRKEAGESLDVHSVASFFVSRVDSEVDKRLAAADREDLVGLAAIANAQAAYESFRRIFHGERFAELKQAGAPVQRPLWASTGVKDERYADTKYVAGLVVPETVNTMPMDTLKACAERLEVEGPAANQDPSEALGRLADAGIDMTDVTRTLLDEGIEKFIEPFDKMIAGLEDQMAKVGQEP